MACGVSFLSSGFGFACGPLFRLPRGGFDRGGLDADRGHLCVRSVDHGVGPCHCPAAPNGSRRGDHPIRRAGKSWRRVTAVSGLAAAAASRTSGTENQTPCLRGLPRDLRHSLPHLPLKQTPQEAQGQRRLSPCFWGYLPVSGRRLLLPTTAANALLEAQVAAAPPPLHHQHHQGRWRLSVLEQVGSLRLLRSRRTAPGSLRRGTTLRGVVPPTRAAAARSLPRSCRRARALFAGRPRAPASTRATAAPRPRPGGGSPAAWPRMQCLWCCGARTGPGASSRSSSPTRSAPASWW
mmetsp:Transcript_67150/g.135335  ORF Transcript_67150/g.135335 Transcript_67150/m.135335 type:complete len:294 (+) Transcript_67150:291-1172(+)